MQKLMLVAGMLVMNEMQLAAQLTFNQPYGSENDYKRLWYLNIQYIQSWVRSDTITYDTLLWAGDFVHQGGANGYLYPKKEIMPIFGQQRFAGIDYFFANNTVIQFINDDAAMVFSRPLYRDRTGAAETVSQYNDIYVKRNGNWICVSANITSVSGSNMPLPVLKEIPPPTTFVTLFSGTETDKTTIKRLNTRFREISEQG
ncbi:MAG: hypothetical protein JNM68_03885, partial [Dinghuibacter sp.]|nr:hypothetical protein [Dinghuibacter sp.]